MEAQTNGWGEGLRLWEKLCLIPSEGGPEGGEVAAGGLATQLGIRLENWKTGGRVKIYPIH